MATTGIVGSGLPIAVGLATAAQLDATGSGDESRVVGVTFGDGATSIGTTHEALNLAALWKLPIVFVCQNNQWGEHTPIAEYAASTELADRARAYGMRAVKVDGFDPIATWRVIRDAVEHARRGDGPVFVEAVTYRLTGHSGTADYGYVPREELDAALARDPAPAFRSWLAAQDLVTQDRLTELDEEAAAYVDDAFVHAEASSAPGPDELLADVFGDDTWVRGLA
jgi:pyruvate dehydrogenase E1 component alpha subunit